MTTTTANIQTVSISSITFDKELQHRNVTCPSHVADLAAIYAEYGEYKDLPVLNHYVDENGLDVYVINDGTHRILGAKDAGATEIKVIVEEVADYLEAQLKSMSVNTQHGKGVTAADIEGMLDKIKNSPVVDRFLKSPYAWDKKALLEHIKCSPRMLNTAISKTAAEFSLARDAHIEELHNEGLSANAIAKEVGCDAKTVRTVITSLLEKRIEIEEGAEELDELGNFDTTEKIPHDSSCPWDDEDDLMVLGDDDDENELAQDTADLIASLCHREEEAVIKPAMSTTPDVNAWAAMYNSMTAEQQTQALKLIGIIK
ncbi:hypothetical protein [Vibrio parahaemolyticus]|uniref:hypothetical protein n=1 Tax=Vibrio parahaemolyticus TaxID=670 RepID=UPI003030B4CD